MPFNGSGTFTRLYSWVQDAANGIDILSTRMDNEMNGMATALSDCVTRDGQSPWTANLPAGGFKITGLGTPTSSADSATKGYVDGIVQGEWKAESNSFAWVSGTQFKLTGVDLTAIYHVGRRVKIVHNSGGSTAYATITATAFSTDTTVTVATDNGDALVASITAVSYGIISYVNPSYLDPRSRSLMQIASTPVTFSATTQQKITFDQTTFDALTEVSSSRFTAIHTGYYLVTSQASYNLNSASWFRLYVYKNGAVLAENSIHVPTVQGGAIAVTALAKLNAGDYLELWFGAGAAGSVEGAGFMDTFLGVARLD